MLHLRQKIKGKGSALPAAYATSVAQTGPVFSLGRSPSPQSRTLPCSHSAVQSPSQPFYGIPPPWSVLHTVSNNDDDDRRLRPTAVADQPDYNQYSKINVQ